MLDADLLIVDGGTIDISSTHDFDTEASTAVNVGKVGLPRDCWFVIHITEGSAQAIEPVVFSLQVTVDNGTTWNTIAKISVNVVTAATPLFAVPCGPVDLRVENYATANIDVRVLPGWVEVENADDVTYDAYLAGPQSFRAFDDA